MANKLTKKSKFLYKYKQFKIHTMYVCVLKKEIELNTEKKRKYHDDYYYYYY